jgi:SAM-dependent methyltransferase
VMADMLEVARQRSAEEGLHNVTFELGDAQVRDFPEAYFDLCISRFGTMFFADPVVAFTNIGRAMRHGARLVMLVWQGRERNEWAVAIQQALAPAATATAPTQVSPAFSLADRTVTARILTAAGFTSIDFAEVHEPVFYGPTVDAAYEAVVDLFLAKDGQAETSSAIDDVHRRLRALLEAQLTADGVLFDSLAWIVTAHRA